MVDKGEVIGFIDIGTNSVHILVVKFFEDSMGTPIFQDKETVRLGQNLYKSGYIDRETIDKTRLVITNFVQISKSMGAKKVISLATCAAREATNKKDLMDAFKIEGTEVKIISGLEEARLISLGVFGPEGPTQQCLEIDIGGGSTEISLCKGKEDLYLDSLSMGAVRFAYGIGIDQKSALSFQDYDHLRRQVDLLSYRTCRKVRDLGFERAYGSSGTLIALAEMCAAKRDGDASYMMYYELVELMKELYTKSEEDRKGVLGMNPSRSDIIVAGGAIAEELMYLLEIDRLEISLNGLKQGMQVEYLLNNGYSDFNVRESFVRNLANRCQYDKAHAETVQKNSLLLFDRMKELGIHKMGDDKRELLSYAALLHDIGEFISYEKHNIHSYIIITNSFLPGFTNDELKMIGLTSRFHHKKFPDAQSKYFVNMDYKDIKSILECSMMLKIADVLDRHRNGSIDKVELNLSDDVLMIELGSERDISMEIWKLNSIREDFKGVFGLDFKIIRS